MTKLPSCVDARRRRFLLHLDYLLKLRIVTARFGEMDRAQWWNTKGQLGPMGATVLRRGFARTHHFAQARSVFAVAAHRCAEVYDPPTAVTLWRLPAEIEEEFDARWDQWLDNAPDWTPTFERLAVIEGEDLVAELRQFVSIALDDLQAVGSWKRSGEGRSVQLPGVFSGTDRDVAQLALAFSKGQEGALAVPWMRRNGT